MHVRRVQQRMAATSSSDPNKSLTRLREMQRSIMQRRSRLQEQSPKPPVVPRNEGQELAEALFPDAHPAVLNASIELAGTSERPGAEGNTLEAPEGPEHVLTNPQDRTSATVGTEVGTLGDRGDVGFVVPERTDTSCHQSTVGGNENVGVGVQGSWRVTASTRSRGSGSAGLSSMSAQRHDSDGSGPLPTESVPGEGSERVPSSSGDVGEQDSWRKEPYKRPRKRSAARTRDSTPTLAIHDSEAPSKPATEGDPVDARSTLSPETDFAIPQGLESDISQLVVTRRSGSLPWMSAEKQQEAAQTSYPQKIVELPALSLFTSDPEWSRKDWRLPRTGQLQFDAKNMTDENVATEDSSLILDGLNTHQTEAVLADPDKACLVLAGPGSGKTRVLTHRVAYLVKRYNVSPYRILAVTFTNKAAEEMKERVSKLLRIKFAPDWAQETGPRLAMGTFHSISARILRKHGADIGISPDFVICDTSDSRQVVSRLMKKAGGSTPDSSAIGQIRSAISKLKNDRDDELRKLWPRHIYRQNAEFRALYDQELRSMNHLDFDDLLVETRKLLQTSARVRDLLQDTYEHVLVDEWQDTNHVQFDLVSLLSGRKQNLFVVGDADQSIYKFRGADSGNLERFTETFPNASKIALERNYRSSACIIAAAQSVIEGNTNRPTKKMTTLNEFGSKITLRETLDDRQETQFVVSTLSRLLRENSVGSHSDVAILYRTNAQSRLIEEGCIQNDIPYRLLSGTKFYDRQEIRDMVAYLRVLSNPADDSAFRRIVNTPPRGIGKKTQDELEKFSESRQLSLLKGLEALLEALTAGEITSADVGLGKGAIVKLAEFQRVMTGLRRASVQFLTDSTSLGAEDVDGSKESVDALLTAVVKDTGYREYLEKRDDSGDTPSEKAIERLGNIEELVRAASRHTNLHRYLEGVTLMVDTMHKREEQEGKDAGKGSAVSLMTLHGGKGLEFAAVFIIGVEDSVIPISRCDDEDIEEERRLFYVGMTRAKKHLYITWRMKKLMLHGGKASWRESVGPSRFLDDIPEKLVNRIETSSSKWKRQKESGKESRGRPGKKASEGRISPVKKGRKNAKVGPTGPTITQWRTGDSVRCGQHGRGTVTIGAPANAEGAWIEVLFADGSKHFVHTVAQDVEMLFSPSA